jgi:hypothetical protein
MNNDTSKAAGRGTPASFDLAKLLDELKTWGGWLALGLSVIGGTPLQVLLVKVFQGPELDVEGAKLIWSVFWLTAPLTSALAILLLAALFGYFSNKDPWECLSIVAITLLASALVGNVLGFRAAGLNDIFQRFATDVDTHPILRLLKAVIGAYLTSYGVQLFFQSITLGGVIGIFVARQIRRHTKRS